MLLPFVLCKSMLRLGQSDYISRNMLEGFLLYMDCITASCVTITMKSVCYENLHFVFTDSLVFSEQVHII